MTKEQAIYDFWASFGLPAYEENSVPKSAKMPYITYEVAIADMFESAMLNASLWYRSGSWQNITYKLKEISENISTGKNLPCENGMLRIRKANPFSSQGGEPSDDMVRKIILTVIVENYTQN